jgi:hypothetical protein
LNFQLSPEQRLLVESAVGLTRREFGAIGRREDIPLGIPRHYLTTLAASGLAGLTLPESEGGQGGTLLDAVLVLEGVAQINPIAGDAVQALNFGAVQQLANLGSPELKDSFLRPCLAGEMLTAIAMTEPEAGSAVSEMRTTARYSGDEVVVNGRKIFTTHGPDADFFVVWARFGDGAGDFGAVIIDRDAPGFSVDSSHSFISGEHYGMLFLDDCTVPKSRVLVDTDGFRRLFAVFNIERLGNATRSLALGQAALDLAVIHSKQRRQFGKPLSDFQGLQWRMAEMALKLEGARLLLYRAASNADQGLPSQRETAVAKLACNRAGFEVADAAMQIFGGHGYDAESVVSYFFSRTRGWLIAGGTAEQMLDRIAKGLLKDSPESGRSS